LRQLDYDNANNYVEGVKYLHKLMNDICHNMCKVLVVMHMYKLPYFLLKKSCCKYLDWIILWTVQPQMWKLF